MADINISLTADEDELLRQIMDSMIAECIVEGTKCKHPEDRQEYYDKADAVRGIAEKLFPFDI